MLNSWYKHGVGKNWFKNLESSLWIPLMFKSRSCPCELIISSIQAGCRRILHAALLTVSMRLYPSTRSICKPIYRSRDVDSSPLGLNGRHFPDDIFKCIFETEKICILIRISLKFVPKGPINNIPALVQIMAWRRSGDKPLSEPMFIQFTDAYMRY